MLRRVNDHERHISAAETEIAQFVEVVGQADVATPVPTCPGWTVADLIRHYGTVQRWITHIVRTLPEERVSEGDLDLGLPDDVNDYPRWLAAGIHVVTPNKLAGSGPLPRWLAIRAACASGARFRYEATVCAGLPVVQTLRDLLDTGDELLAVEGMFSGTLAWLCNRHDGQQPFSALVREAHALGYTEPYPRDDLSGLDVARKLVILAREAGWPLSLEEVAVESLVPSALAALPLDACMQRLDLLDASMAARLAEAQALGGVLRHVASLDRHGRARVKLVVLPAQHPFAHTRLTDNVVQFTSRRYCDNPLLVQGPGAGPEVTAAGVFSDLLRIAESLEVRA